MPVTRPDYWPLVALTPLANFAIPPSGVILQGWGIGAVFPSRDANWLFRQHGDWLKYTDARALHGADGLDPSVVQRVSSTQLDFPTGAGLQVAPSSGGVYIIGGERVDLSDAPGTYTGVMAPTFAPSTTNYVHVRLMPDTGGMVTIGSVGDLLVSTNIAEAGYSLILSVATDATDITATGEPGSLVLGYRWANPWQFADDVDMVDLVVNNALFFGRAVGSGVAGFNTLSLTPGDATAKALSAIGFTADDLVHITQTGAGYAVNVAGGASAMAMNVTGGTGQIAIGATAGNNAQSAIMGIGTGTAVGVIGSGGPGDADAVGVRGSASHADAAGVYGRTSLSASTTAAGVKGEGRGAGSNGVHALSTVGRALLVQGDASTPAYPAMRVMPQDADPSIAPEDGDTFWHADHKSLRTGASGGGYRTMLTMGPGSAVYVVASQNAGVEKIANSVYDPLDPLLVANCLEAQGQGVFDGGVRITFSCNTRSEAGTSTYLGIRLRNVATGATIAEWAGSGTGASAGFLLPMPTNEWAQPPVTLSVMYDPFPNYGDLSIAVDVRSGPTDIGIRNATITVVGTFLVA